MSSLLTQLFDKDSFSAQLNSSGNLISTCRTTIEEVTSKLDALYQTGHETVELVNARAEFIDTLLSKIWNTFQIEDSIALLAVGGYGRGQLFPHSDIDLLILLNKETSTNQESQLKAFLTLLWDLKLDIGHSVRTIPECVTAAKEDITIATSLTESRTICGDKSLRPILNQQIGPDCIWDNQTFFRAKWKEQIARHHKHNNTEYNLEPNLKNAPGGLRDLQTIGWVAKRHFQVGSYADLVDKGFITKEELSLVRQSRYELWKIRYGLHLIAGRAEERLLFHHQRELATLFGYKDTQERLAVEQFMQHYYQTALRIREINDLLLHYLDETILRADEPDTIKPINSRFQIHNNYIEATNDRVFKETPSALLEVFVLMGQNPEIQGMRASTIRLVRDHRHLIDDQFRQDIRNISLFSELLRIPSGLVTQLKRMKRYGILGKYLPEFGKVIGQMQHDLFHIYTVDAHTLLVVKNMRRFRHKDMEEQFPIAYKIVRRLPKIELLYIAGLYHDIAKGRGGDHSELGAQDAIEFCKRHRLPPMGY